MPGGLFAQGLIENGEWPETLSLGFYEGWTRTESRLKSYFAYEARDEENLKRILNDDLTEGDVPFFQQHYFNPEDNTERVIVIYDGEAFPDLIFFNEFFGDDNNSSSMYIPKFSENRMAVEGWQLVPSKLYPEGESLEDIARYIYENSGKYLVFMNRRRSDEYVNSEIFKTWMRGKPYESRLVLVAKDTTQALAIPVEKHTSEMYVKPWEFPLVRFNHPHTSEMFIIIGMPKEEGVEEMLLVHFLDYIQGGLTAEADAWFYKGTDGKWHRVPDEMYYGSQKDFVYYLADESRAGRFFLFGVSFEK
jgi:hypothetical protein